MLLIEEGADVSIRNDEGLLPKEMTKNKEIIRLIEGMLLWLCWAVMSVLAIFQLVTLFLGMSIS